MFILIKFYLDVRQNKTVEERKKNDVLLSSHGLVSLPSNILNDNYYIK